MKRWLARSLGCIVAAGLLAASASAQDARLELAKESVLEAVQKRGKLVVGVSTFVPWSMRDKKGQLIGFEIDVASKVAEDMGVKVEFVPTAWDGIIPALLGSKFDIIISGMSVTSKRNLKVNFTRPYARTGYILVANSEIAKKKGLSALADFDRPDVSIASRRASTGATAMQTHFPKARKVYFDDDALSYQELANGNVDATGSTLPKAAFELEKRGDVFHIVSNEQLSPTRESFALRKGDPDALNYFNNWIQEAEASGWMAERRAHWFTTRDWADQVSQ